MTSFRFIVFSILVLVLASCAEYSGNAGHDETNGIVSGTMSDTSIYAVRDSSYRHHHNYMGSGNLSIGHYRGIDAGILLRYDAYDSLSLDTSRFDSFRVDDAWIMFHQIREDFAYLAEPGRCRSPSNSINPGSSGV